MTIYHLTPNADFASDAVVEEDRRWLLPGVKCDSCGRTWAGTGLSYPSVDLSAWDGQRRYHSAFPVPLAAFEKLRKDVEWAVPKGASLRPGTRFGPLGGTAIGRFGEVEWFFCWGLLLSARVLAELQRAGAMGVKGVPVEAKKGRRRLELLELEILPGARIQAPADVVKCASCGREAFTRPKRIVVEGPLPKGTDIFRAGNSTATIIATERLKLALEPLQDGRITFEPIALATS
jgi:uncharacterized double-CXXCG motif protein